MGEMYNRLSAEDKHIVDLHREVIAGLVPMLDKYRPFTRPLGKAQVTFAQAQMYENKFNQLSDQAKKHESTIRKIYRKYYEHL